MPHNGKAEEEEREDQEVHRLEDIDTKEVSLVPRGANRRTFLVVKNEEGTVGANTKKTEKTDATELFENGDGTLDTSKDDDKSDDEEKGKDEKKTEDTDKDDSAKQDAPAHWALCQEKMEGMKVAVDKLKSMIGTADVSDVLAQTRAVSSLAWSLSDAVHDLDTITKSDEFVERKGEVFKALGEVFEVIKDATEKATKKPKEDEKDDEKDAAEKKGGDDKKDDKKEDDKDDKVDESKVTKEAVDAIVEQFGSFVDTVKTELGKVVGRVDALSKRVDTVAKSAGVPTTTSNEDDPPRTVQSKSDDFKWPRDITRATDKEMGIK